MKLGPKHQHLTVPPALICLPSSRLESIVVFFDRLGCAYRVSPPLLNPAISLLCVCHHALLPCPSNTTDRRFSRFSDSQLTSGILKPGTFTPTTLLQRESGSDSGTGYTSPSIKPPHFLVHPPPHFHRISKALDLEAAASASD